MSTEKSAEVALGPGEYTSSELAFPEAAYRVPPTPAPAPVVVPKSVGIGIAGVLALILAFAVALVVAVFVTQNTARIDVKLFTQARNVTVALAVGASAGAGVIVGLLCGVVPQVRLRREIRQLRRALR